MALRSTAAVYTYCRSRGLFAGISLEGSCLIERKETNRKYGGKTRINLLHVRSLTSSVFSKQVLVFNPVVLLQILLPRHPRICHFEW